MKAKLFWGLRIFAIIALPILVAGVLWQSYHAQRLERADGDKIYFGLRKHTPELRAGDTLILRRDLFRKFERRDYLRFTADNAGANTEDAEKSTEKFFAITANGKPAEFVLKRNRALGRKLAYFKIPSRTYEIRIALSEYGAASHAALTRVDPYVANGALIAIFAAAIAVLLALIFINSTIRAGKAVVRIALLLDEAAATENVEPRVPWRLRRQRAGIVFGVVLIAGLAFRVLYPTEFHDAVGNDYNMTAAEHALAFADRMNGAPNDGDMNINSHPGLPYYVVQGVARYLAIGGGGNNPIDRAVHFFRHIESWWKMQAVFSAILFATGAAIFALYARHLPLALIFALLPITLILADIPYVGILEQTSNESFALPFAGIFLLLAQIIFSRLTGGEKIRGLVFALGAISCVIYTIKLPYVIFVFGGLIVPLACGYSRRSVKTGIKYGVWYLGGFLAAMLAVILAFGPNVVISFLRYHYGVLTHTGFAGTGEDGITSANTLIHNFTDFVLPFLGRQIAPWLFAAIMGGVILAVAALRQSLVFESQARILLIIAMYALNVAVIAKHPGHHYGFVQIIMLMFLVSELASVFYRALRPVAIWYRGKILLTVIAAMVSLAVAMPPTAKLAARLAKLPAWRIERDKFMEAIRQLPLAENEGVYFQWGTHATKFMLDMWALDFNRVRESRYVERVGKALYPAQWRSAGVYPRQEEDADSLNIRYLVASRTYAADGDLLADAAIDQPIIPWDMPDPRCLREKADRIALYWDGQTTGNDNIVVIEKAIPICPEEK